MVNLNPFKNNIKYLKKDGKPKSIVRTGDAQGGAGISSKERSPSLLRTYWDYYSGEGTIFASINSIALNTTMVGYTLDSENEKALQLITALCRKVRLPNITKEAVKNALIFGDAFVEKVMNGKSEISRLKVVDSRTVIINDDKYGDVIDYQQYIGGKVVGSPLKPEDLLHIRLFPIPGSPYGLSLLGPNLDTIDRKVATDESLYNAIQRHTAKYVVTVGSEKDGQVPPATVMDDIKKEFEDITSKNEFIVPWFISIDTIDERGVQGVREYYDLFQTQMIVGLMCPEEALGQGKGSTEATARVKAVLYERMIKGFQTDLSIMLEEQLFKPYLDANGIDIEKPENWVYINFNGVTAEDEALKAKWWGNILRGFKGEIPLTGNEFRAQFGLKPKEGLDELLTNKDVENVEDIGEEEENDNEQESTPASSESEVSDEDDTEE